MVRCVNAYPNISVTVLVAQSKRQKKERNTKRYVGGGLRIASRVIAGVNFAGDMYLDYANAR